MDLASMLKREDFLPIFFETIKKYYSQVYNADVEVEISDKKKCNLVIKPYLSCATAPHMSAAARGNFYSEWNIRNSLIKHLVAKLGVFVLTHTGKALSQFCFYMSPEQYVTRDLVIAPNNRSIRFFDYKENTVGCMIKSGFTDKYFSNQLRFRKQYHYPFMLPMVRYGEQWFIEPILSGHPLARVVDEKAYQKGMSDALKGIRLLAEDTLTETDSTAYIEKLLSSISEHLIEAAERKKIKSYGNAKEIAERAAKYAAELKKVPVCQSHGDFQSGNIWVDDDGKTWIYDWETAGTRSAWYDTTVLAYSLRRPYGWAELIGNEKPEKMLNCTPDLSPDFKMYTSMKYLVLLEELMFYLEDMLELPNDWGGEIFDAFIARLSDADI